MDTDWPHAASGFSLVYCCNYHVKDGSLPSEQCQSSKTVLDAIRSAVDAGLDVHLVAAVSSRDADFFRDFFRGEKRVVVGELPRRSSERRYPCLADILETAWEKMRDLPCGQTPATFCVYANSDICVPSYFFQLLGMQFDQSIRGTFATAGHTHPDAVVINRRNIIPIQQNGESGGESCGIRWHPGYDCFAFRAALINSLSLGETAVGHPPVGALLLLNLLALCRRVLVLRDLFITWHHGGNGAWSADKNSEETARNADCAVDALVRLAVSENIDLPSLKTISFERDLLERAIKRLPPNKAARRPGLFDRFRRRK